MTILLVCNNNKDIVHLENIVSLCYPQSRIITALGLDEGMRHVCSGNRIDICFAEVILDKGSGFQVVKALRYRNPGSKIVLIAPDERFAMGGWEVRMNDYLIRPVTVDAIRHTLISCAQDDRGV